MKIEDEYYNFINTCLKKSYDHVIWSVFKGKQTFYELYESIKSNLSSYYETNFIKNLEVGELSNMDDLYNAKRTFKIASYVDFDINAELYNFKKMRERVRIKFDYNDCSITINYYIYTL